MAFRSFISVDVGSRLDWHSLRKELAEVDRGVRPVRPEQLHLTLRFLGDTDEGLVDGLQELMVLSVDGMEPFHITFEGVGAFPNARRPRVVWIGLHGAEPLVDIARRLERGVVELGWQPEGRGFRPHATVARIKRVRRQGRLSSLLDRWRDASFGSMEVRSLVLKRSELTPQGAIYTDVLSVPIGGH
jgi:2'-5' RNA ligase